MRRVEKKLYALYGEKRKCDLSYEYLCSDLEKLRYF